MILTKKLKFYIIYNGVQSFGAKELRLSDAFITHEAEPALELLAKVVDINTGSGEPALARSTTLQGYSHLICEVRKNLNAGMTRDKAIVVSIDSCIAQGVLSEFLTEHYLEVSKMLTWEYDADAVERVLKREAREEGLREGREEGREEGLREEKNSIARKLKQSGIMTNSQIVEITGLSEVEIEKL